MEDSLSLTFFLGTAGVILMGVGVCIFLVALLFVRKLIDWPWPISLFDPIGLQSFSVNLVYAGLGLLALGVLLEMAAFLW